MHPLVDYQSDLLADAPNHHLHRSRKLDPHRILRAHVARVERATLANHGGDILEVVEVMLMQQELGRRAQVRRGVAIQKYSRILR